MTKKKKPTVVIDAVYVESIKETLLNRLLARICLLILGACLFKYLYHFNSFISEKQLIVILTIITIFVFALALDTFFAVINYFRFCMGKITIKKNSVRPIKKLVELLKVSLNANYTATNTTSYYFKETPLFKINLISDGLKRIEVEKEKFTK